MNTNTKRMVLAAIAAFYVVVGGLWASNFIPLKHFDAQMARKEKLIDNMGFSAAYDSEEYQKTEAYLLNNVLSYEGKVLKARRFGSIILWGTIALAAGGGVLFMTRGRKTAQAGAQ
ncbi:hypothetical protein [Brevundimonas sp.]|uniref:hypothetical protein n=1 Tax=Brevundimonas sp. TaxID=1871086 RepID=UPI00289E652C|nr:hypothetical protein [Brevundimonas sp.]